MLTGHITFAAKVTSPIAIQTKEPFDVDEIPGVEKATVDLTDVNKARITIKFAQVESDELVKRSPNN